MKEQNAIYEAFIHTYYINAINFYAPQAYVYWIHIVQ